MRFSKWAHRSCYYKIYSDHGIVLENPFTVIMRNAKDNLISNHQISRTRSSERSSQHKR